jgi:hypothetical protein
MNPQRRASVAFVYFGIAFTLSAALSMVALTFVRPHLQGLPQTFMMGFMMAPAVIGIFYGVRVARAGVRDNLRLGAALKRGLFLG